MTDAVINTKNISISARSVWREGLWNKTQKVVIKDWLRSSNQLRSYNEASQRINNLLMTINPDTDQETAAKVKLCHEDFFSMMNSGNETLRKGRYWYREQSW